MIHNPADWAIFDDVYTNHGASGVGLPALLLDPPRNRDYEVAAIAVHLQTSAVVANRYIYIQSNGAGGWGLLALCTIPLTANQHWILDFAQGHAEAQIPGLPYVTWPLPQRLRFPPNQYMQVNVFNMDGADQIVNVTSALNMQIIRSA